MFHPFLVVYTNCIRPRCSGRSGKQKQLQAILENIEGYDIFPEDRVDAADNMNLLNKSLHDEKDKDAEKHQNTSHISAPQKGISAMEFLFAQDTRATGEENELFTSRLTPICDQMNNLQIAKESQPSVLFSLLTGPARDACERMQLQNITLDEMIAEIKLKVIFDSDIQDRRISRWTSVDYSEFRRNTDNEEKATRKSIDLMTKYQRDLPTHMRVPALLYNRF